MKFIQIALLSTLGFYGLVFVFANVFGALKHSLPGRFREEDSRRRDWVFLFIGLLCLALTAFCQVLLVRKIMELL